jgi:site-specific DNA-cytosine methylase
VLGPKRAICWRILDAQYFALAQRRRHVFLVACPRDGTDPRTILFEFDCLRRDTPPRRQARTDIAGTLESSIGRSRGAGISLAAICPHVSCKWSKGTGGPAGDEHQNLVVPPPLTGNQYGDHESREGLLQVLANSAVRRITPRECERLQGFPDDYTLIPGHKSWRDVDPGEDVDSLKTRGLKVRQTKAGKWRVNDPDGPRYRVLGNSMAVPVMRWIGERAAGHAALHGIGVTP